SSEVEIHVAILAMTLEDSPNGEIVDYSLEAEIPTIVLTGILSDEVIDQYSSKAIIDYISKNSMQDIAYTVEVVETLYYFKSRKALIVDDSKTTQLYISLFFDAIMMEPVFASSGEEAIEMLHKHDDIDIITTDLMMPGMNGLELIQKIKGTFAKKIFNIIAITGQNETTTITKFLKSGADDFLGKPFTKEEFNTRVIKILSYTRKMDEINKYSKLTEQHILSSETDGRGIIRKSSESFSELSGYSKNELIGNPHNLVRHPDMPAEVFADIWKTIKAGDTWHGEVQNLKKEGGSYWVDAFISPIYNHGTNELIGYRSLRKDITAKKLVEQKSAELEVAKQKITDSIEFASIIQKAFLPDMKLLEGFYDDYFINWEPKDIVGGDIYSFMKLKEQSLLFMIDCTGHGVPGAFMTMIVKTTIEAIVTEVNFDDPALILSELNRRIKMTLKQNDLNSDSDAGLDGGILFFDKKKNLIRYAGAKTPLFYVDNGTLQSFKSDRASIGYKKSKDDFIFTNFSLELTSPIRLYITTDGFLDQNGGEEGFPYGKSKFQKLLELHYSKKMVEQERIFKEELLDYQGEYERDDDITFCGIEIIPHQNEIVDKNYTEKRFVESFKEIIYEKEGQIKQDDLKEVEIKLLDYFKTEQLAMNKFESLMTMVYEVGQNLMNYSNNDVLVKAHTMFPITLKIGIESDGTTICIQSGNTVTNKDREKIEQRIATMIDLDKDEIKEFYRMVRKSGAFGHDRGAGLGFLELAKRVSRPINFSMHTIDDTYSYFSLFLQI
ncbi:MAG: DUF6272 family protein, partial [Thiovulaceae bacterium]|nr:DUF6272 family protein [Sulfurimonadaceae bacterium]